MVDGTMENMLINFWGGTNKEVKSHKMLISITFGLVGDFTLNLDFQQVIYLLVPCCHCSFFGGWSKFGHELYKSVKIRKIQNIRQKIGN